MEPTVFITAAISATFGGFITHLWNRYNSRLITLRYYASHNKIAYSAEDAIFGSVKVTYNDVAVQNLFYSTVYVFNESGRDLDSFVLNLSADAESRLVVSHALKSDSVNPLQFTEEYNAKMNNQVIENLPFLLSRRDYIVPSLNRGESLTIASVIMRDNAEMPELTLSTDTKGIRAKHKVEPTKIVGESLLGSLVSGLILSAALCFLIYSFLDLKWLIISLSLTIGLASTLIGALALKILRGILLILR